MQMNKIDGNIKFYLWIAFFVISWMFLSLNSYHTKKFERLCYASEALLYQPIAMETMDKKSEFPFFGSSEKLSEYWNEQQKRAEMYDAVTSYGEEEFMTCIQTDDYMPCSLHLDDPTDVIYAFDELNNLYNNIHNICALEGSRRVMDFIYRVGNLKTKLESFRDTK